MRWLLRLIPAGVLGIILLQAKAGAASVLKAEFDGQGIKSLKFGNLEFVDDTKRTPSIRMEFTPPDSSQSHEETQWSGSEGPGNNHKWVLPGGEITIAYQPAAISLGVQISVKNTGTNTITGIDLKPFAMQFPKKPKGRQWRDNWESATDNLGQPAILTADWGSGAVVVCNEEFDRPCGLQWASLGAGKKVARGIGIRTVGDLPISPGQTVVFNFSIRFTSDPRNLDKLTADIRSRFVKAYPSTFEWPDRRPIGTVFLAAPGMNYPGNPRGYFNDSSLNVEERAGKAKLRERLMKLAERSIAALKVAGAQGVVVWDIEGGEMPHAITYLGDPRALPKVAPEMDAIADEFFKKFRDAGFRVGVCIRPTNIVFKDPAKYPWIKTRYGHTDDDHPINTLADKIEYAKKRWGCTIFYVDTDYTPLVINGKPRRGKDGALQFRLLSASEMRELHRKEPDCLIFPEVQTAGFFASVSGYREFSGVDDFSADVRQYYPHAFRVWMPRLSVGDVYEHWNDFVEKGAMAGEVFLFECMSGPSAYANLLRNAQADAAMRQKPVQPLPVDLRDLLQMLWRERSWPARRRVIEALARYTDPAATGALAKILRSDADGLDYFAAGSLGMSGTPAALRVLSGGLRDGKISAAFGLGVSGKPEAVPPLVAVVNSAAKPAMRWAAIDALGALKRPEAVPALLNVMKSSPDSAAASRFKAIVALGRIGDPRPAGPLIEALASHDFAADRQEIADALVAITGFDGGAGSVLDVETWKEWQQRH